MITKCIWISFFWHTKI